MKFLHLIFNFCVAPVRGLVFMPVKQQKVWGIFLDLLTWNWEFTQSSWCWTLNAVCYGVRRGMLASQDWTVSQELRSGSHSLCAFILTSSQHLFCLFLFWGGFWIAIKGGLFFLQICTASSLFITLFSCIFFIYAYCVSFFLNIFIHIIFWMLSWLYLYKRHYIY